MAKQNAVPVYQEQQESKQVKRDLIRVIILNAFFFALLFGLYFMNKGNGIVDKFFEKLLKF
jgi:hypothetical protein